MPWLCVTHIKVNEYDTSSDPLVKASFFHEQGRSKAIILRILFAELM